jgi:hypothetical protein
LKEKIYDKKALTDIIFDALGLIEEEQKEEREFSDIDLLLLVRVELTTEEREKMYLTVSNISLKNNAVISLIDYPVAIFNSFNTPFLQSVRREEIEKGWRKIKGV